MQPQIERIVVPIDFTIASARAAAYAQALARPTGAALYLVHVLPPAVAAARARGTSASPVADPREREYQEARVRLEILGRRLGAAPRVTTEVRTGEIAESIAEAAVHYGADLVIMATNGRTGVSHLLAGSVAERVIRRGPCPVLVLRAPGTAKVHRPERQSRVA